MSKPKGLTLTRAEKVFLLEVMKDKTDILKKEATEYERLLNEARKGSSRSWIAADRERFAKELESREATFQVLLGLLRKVTSVGATDE